MTKPCALEELSARGRAVVRRSRPREQGRILRIGDLLLDAASRTAARGGEPIDLTRREFELLEFLMRHPDLALERSTLLSEVCGYDVSGRSNIVDVYVRYLRRKIERIGKPQLICTVRGVGYALRPPR